MDVREHPAHSGFEAVDPYYGTPPKPHDIAPTNFKEGLKVAPPEDYGMHREMMQKLPEAGLDKGF